VVERLGWWSAEDGETSEALHRQVKRAQALLAEARREVGVVSLLPHGSGHEWRHADVTLPAVHVKGSFVLWRSGLPPAAVYPAILPFLPRADLSLSATPGGTRMPSREGGRIATRVLIIEIEGAHALAPALAQMRAHGDAHGDDGRALNAYIVAEIGGQRLLVQPSPAYDDTNGRRRSVVHPGTGLRTAGGPTASFGGARGGERFVVVLEGDEPAASLQLRLYHKRTNAWGAFDSVAGAMAAASGGPRARASIGGPPWVCAHLGSFDACGDRSVGGELRAALGAEVAREAAEARAAEGGGDGGGGGGGGSGGGWFSRLFSSSDSLLDRDDSPKSARPPAAPEDLLLAEGSLDLAPELSAEGGPPREVNVKLAAPVAEVIAHSKLASNLSVLLRRRFEKDFDFDTAADGTMGRASHTAHGPCLLLTPLLPLQASRRRISSTLLARRSTT
jgi:hypothetical protein